MGGLLITFALPGNPDAAVAAITDHLADLLASGRARYPDLATAAMGVTIVFAHLSQRNIASMLRGTIIAMALISLILIGVFRSVTLSWQQRCLTPVLAA